MPIHNKLVRDQIPKVIEGTGKKFTTRILEDAEYISELQKKAFEELNEYIGAETKEAAVEELADLLEVVHALARVQGSSIHEVEEIRIMKAEKRGGFKEKVYLIEVEDGLG